MANIVYFLGAGFSAPLGLPVMSNFIDMSKDMYFSDTKKYGHIEQMINMVDDYARIKHYMKSDLFNIEEMLSIVEMNDTIQKTSNAKIFEQCIKDVILHYTPSIPKPQLRAYDDGQWGQTDSEYGRFIFGPENILASFGHFVAGLAGLYMKIERSHDRKEYVVLCKPRRGQHTYSIITTNYDLVIENFLAYIDHQFLKREDDGDWKYENSLEVVKLHGSVNADIILPSWRKTEMGKVEQVNNAWEKAGQLLANANQIRIIGYSLPESDVYVRYLFKAAIYISRNLKQVDVWCDDPDHSVEHRYKNLFEERFSHFYSDLTENILPKYTNQKHESIGVPGPTSSTHYFCSGK